MIRIDGSMKKMKMPALTPDQTRDGLYDIMGDAQRAVFEEKNDIDFSIELGTMARFRVNIFNQNRGMGGVFRVIPTKIMTCLLYTSPSPRDRTRSRMPSSA